MAGVLKLSNVVFVPWCASGCLESGDRDYFIPVTRVDFERWRLLNDRVVSCVHVCGGGL